MKTVIKIIRTRKCSDCKAPVHTATGHWFTLRTVLCGSCARDWFQWMKSRMGAMQAVLKRGGGKESFHDVALKSIIGNSGVKVPAYGDCCVVWHGNDRLHVFMRKSKGYIKDGSLVTFDFSGKGEESWDRWQSYKLKVR